MRPAGKHGIITWNTVLRVEGTAMTYRGHVENGRVVVEDDVDLPDGTPVEVKPVRVKAPGRAHAPAKDKLTVSRRLLKYAGKAKGLPRDAARNLDHYLYGHPKQ
jgi:hypothetical protein